MTISHRSYVNYLVDLMQVVLCQVMQQHALAPMDSNQTQMLPQGVQPVQMILTAPEAKHVKIMIVSPLVVVILIVRALNHVQTISV